MGANKAKGRSVQESETKGSDCFLGFKKHVNANVHQYEQCLCCIKQEVKLTLFLGEKGGPLSETK